MKDFPKIKYLIDVKKYDQALTAIENSLSINPSDSSYYYLASICYQAKQEIQLAKDAISSAIVYDPSENLYKLQLAALHIASDDLKACKSILTKVSPINESEIIDKYELQAFLEIRQENFQQARKIAKKIVRLNPEYANAFAIIAFTELIIGSKEDSITYVNRSLTLNPENVFSRYVLILSKLLQNDVKSAKNQILQVLSEDPHNQLYIEGLRIVLLSKNSISRIIVKLRLFTVRHYETLQKLYGIIFRLMVISAFLFYMVTGEFLFWYSTILLIAHSLSSIPFKTLPMIQNLFLLGNKMKNIVISNSEVLFSIITFISAAIGTTLLFLFPESHRFITIGLCVLYFSGLPFDYYFGIQKNYRNQLWIYILLALTILTTLLFINQEWLGLSYFLIVAYLVTYTFWYRRANIKAI